MNGMNGETRADWTEDDARAAEREIAAFERACGTIEMRDLAEEVVEAFLAEGQRLRQRALVIRLVVQAHRNVDPWG